MGLDTIHLCALVSAYPQGHQGSLASYQHHGRRQRRRLLLCCLKVAAPAMRR